MPFSEDTEMSEILDNEEAKAVLTKHVPEVATAGPLLNLARGMTLKTVAGFPQAKISPEKLAAIVEDLQELERA